MAHAGLNKQFAVLKMKPYDGAREHGFRGILDGVEENILQSELCLTGLGIDVDGDFSKVFLFLRISWFHRRGRSAAHDDGPRGFFEDHEMVGYHGSYCPCIVNLVLH